MAYWNTEGVALNSNDFVLSKESVSKAADSNGRPPDCRILDFFFIKAKLKMSNMGHDAAGSAANAAYFGAFLVKGNRFGAFLTATSPKKSPAAQASGVRGGVRR
jgi:hypothetical protein